MDSHHEAEEVDEQQHHPSHSIPDAAYPEAPYQPGFGQQPEKGGQSGPGGPHTIALPPPSLTYQPSQSHSQLSLHPSEGSRTQLTAQEAGPSAQQLPSQWAHEPPPPYQRNEAQRESQSNPSHGHQPSDIPLQDLSTPGLVSQARNTPPQDAATREMVGESTVAQDGTGSTRSLKPGDADMRLRRRRRMKICGIILAGVLLFVIALVLGIALGVAKSRHHPPSRPSQPPKEP